MTVAATLYHQFKRYRTLRTDHISALPIVILMPHSACNCKCVMCDIWKDNKNLKQLTEQDIHILLESLKKFGTQQVLMSGGEALLNPNFFRFCELLNKENIKVTLLSTGLTLNKHALAITELVHDVIVSLDGPEEVHDRIRNIPGAFRKMTEGINAIRFIDPNYKITARTVIHKLNFRHWISIIESAKKAGIDQISFLPADVSSHAFNRELLWTDQRQQEVKPAIGELPELRKILDTVIDNYRSYGPGFFAESPVKLEKIYSYYAALYKLNDFPFKKCNAPWVSTVVEADGTVRPCFFHLPIGNIHEQSLGEILNSESAIRFRKELDTDSNETCSRCVCYLNLSPGAKLY